MCVFFCVVLRSLLGRAAEASRAKDLASRSLKRAAPLISAAAARLEVPNVHSVKVADACGGSGPLSECQAMKIVGRVMTIIMKIKKTLPPRWRSRNEVGDDGEAPLCPFLSPSYKSTFKSEGARAWAGRQVAAPIPSADSESQQMVL